MAGDEKRFKSAFDSLHALAYFAPEVDHLEGHLPAFRVSEFLGKLLRRYGREQELIPPA